MIESNGNNTVQKRTAYYGGSFDPCHNGHLVIADKLTRYFSLDQFVFIPAFHAPHKQNKKPRSAYQRFAMLAIATNNQPKIEVSKIELDLPGKPYTIETLTKIKQESPDDDIFFVMGADSWAEINTWRDWESVLSIVNIIVVTRPPIEIGFSHVTPSIRERIVDLRGKSGKMALQRCVDRRIYITDVVNMDISSSEIREEIRNNSNDWRSQVPIGVAKFIDKYRIY